MRLISKAAEAKIYVDEKSIVKKRVEKKYRIKPLDTSIRRLRTKAEARNLRRLRGVINVPQLWDVVEEEFQINLELVEGCLVKEFFEQSSDVQQTSYEIGSQIKRMHEANIIHNDLTTSNMLLSDSTVFFIDFGLSEFSRKTEDKAVDLVVFKKSLMATHPGKHERIWKNVVKGYAPDSAIKTKVKQILLRVRYR